MIELLSNTLSHFTLFLNAGIQTQGMRCFAASVPVDYSLMRHNRNDRNLKFASSKAVIIAHFALILACFALGSAAMPPFSHRQVVGLSFFPS